MKSPKNPYNLYGDHKTGFEKRTMQSVIESAIYTSDGMFGEIAFDAEVELKRRLSILYPPPKWAKKHYEQRS